MSRDRRASQIEIQIHSSDIRKRVRYLFLTRRQVVGIALGLGLYLAFLVTAACLTPGWFRGWLSRAEHDELLDERKRQGERLTIQVERLAELEAQSEALRLQLDQIFLAYGLSTDESIGQGGYPFEIPPSIDSIYSSLIDRGATQATQVHEQTQVLGAFLDEVHSFEEAHAEQIRTTPSMSPLRGDDFVLTSPFGYRTSPFTKQLDFHAGIDLAAPPGKPVYAPADGVVTFAGQYPKNRSVAWWRYGKLVVVKSGEHFVTLFGHLSEVRVRRGQQVRQGDLLATVGDTGWSTSPHLHYEVRRRDDDGMLRPVDPRIYILDHRWRGDEQMLIRARTAPSTDGFEPLPSLLAR